MLLLLLLHTATVVASSTPTSGDKDTSDSCDDINNCRKLSSIILSCLGTVFLCTWVVLHPPVPVPANPRETILKKVLRFITPSIKLRNALVALVFPELVLMIAVFEWLKVQNLVRENRDLSLTKTQGFFIIMGGFYSIGDPDKPISYDNPWARRLGSETVIPLLRAEGTLLPSEEEIQDKSKSDWIAKVFAVIQLFWFILQCIARAVEHLPLTDLEIVTLAYPLVAFGIYFVWWNKPCDINCAIRVPQARFDLQNLNQPDEEKTGQLWKVFGVQEKVAIMLIILLGVLLGAIHFIAWSSKFPTHTQLVLWRASCIIMVVSPFIVYPWAIFLRGPEGDNWNPYLGIFPFIANFFTGCFTCAYMFARATTVILALITLKSLPLAAYTDVQWPSFIPHI